MINKTMLRLYVRAHTAIQVQPRQDLRDRGSNSVETAVIVGVVATAAIALTTAMVTAINHYKGMIPGGG